MPPNRCAPITITAVFCGVDTLDGYIQRQATQDKKRNLAASFVLCEEGSNIVLAYYTLSAFSVDLGDMPEGIRRKRPKYSPLPAMLIGRLAVDARCRGTGVGAQLLADALLRIEAMREQAGIGFVIVDAMDDKAHGFYEHFGFTACVDAANRMYMPMKTVSTVVNSTAPCPT